MWHVALRQIRGELCVARHVIMLSNTLPNSCDFSTSPPPSPASIRPFLRDTNAPFCNDILINDRRRYRLY